MKKSLVYLSMAFLSYATLSCEEAPKKDKESEKTEIKEDHEVKMVMFTMAPKSGSTANGKASFKDEDGTVTFKAELTGLEPGEHAIHIHEKADCSSDDGKSAGGHWNPTKQKHGKWGDPTGYHKGDIGNFTADADGNATIEFSTDEWCVACEDETKNVVGKGIIVHSGTDDFTSQPSGDAGSRISCGGIIE